MIKKLYLIRHAKSSWEHPELPDFERPLNERGKLDAAHMAAWLQAQNVQPNLIISSLAKRAVATAAEFAKASHYPYEHIDFRKDIYEAGVEDLLVIVKAIPDEMDEVFLIGHSPSLNWLANYLCNDHLVNIPTAGIYCIAFQARHWSAITDIENKCLFFEFPQHLE